MDIRIQGGIEQQGFPDHPQAIERVRDKGASREEAPVKKEEEEKKEYTHEDAVMDVEAVKRFLYMLAGIPYVSKDDAGKTQQGIDIVS